MFATCQHKPFCVVERERPKSHTPASRATLCNLLRLYMAIFKGLASPTANPETAECCSRITCTPPPRPRPGEISPRVPRALCPLCRRQRHTDKGTGSPTNQNLAVQRRGKGLLGGPLHRGPFEKRSHPEGRNRSRRARPDLPSLCRTNLASP